MFSFGITCDILEYVLDCKQGAASPFPSTQASPRLIRSTMAARKQQADQWRNRIVGMGEEAPDQLLANAANWRIHPKNQQDALSGVLNSVGWVTGVIVNKRSGTIVDGHLRAALSISRNEPTIPVIYVDLTDAEEALILATLDPISAMAATDADKLRELMELVSTDEPAIGAMLAALGESSGAIEPDWAAGFAGVPDGDKAPFQQMTFTVADSQIDVIKAAMSKALKSGVTHPDNENSNGNALWGLADAYLNG